MWLCVVILVGYQSVKIGGMNGILAGSRGNGVSIFIGIGFSNLQSSHRDISMHASGQLAAFWYAASPII